MCYIRTPNRRSVLFSDNTFFQADGFRQDEISNYCFHFPLNCKRDKFHILILSNMLLYLYFLYVVDNGNPNLMNLIYKIN